MIADDAVRQRALDANRSFIVQAPAGSGKTDLLVKRYLRLLSLCRNPEEVLAITFTRKAAAEMRKRVLETMAKDPVLAVRVPEIAHRLRIETIDAFCLSLTRQVPVLSRFGAQPEMLLDAQALYREAAETALRDFDNPNVVRLLAHLDNDLGSAAGLLAAMLERRDQWLRQADTPPTRAELEAVMAAERERLLARARTLHPKASEEFARLSLTKKFEWLKKPKSGIPPEEQTEELRQALEALLCAPPAAYSPEQWEVLDAMLSLLPHSAKVLRALFAVDNRADFTEVAQGAVRALGAVDDPSDLLLKLDAKLSHILVDEFQDTSVSQWDLLERLTAGWQAGDGRTVFLVGDPMQSIYRFRQAEVGLFLRAQRHGLPNVPLEALQLTSNFRSQEQLVTWFNTVFPRVLPQAVDEAAGAVPYAASTPTRDPLPGTGVAWHLFWDRKDETERVVQLVREAEGRTAILVRNRTHLAEIVPALKAAGLRFRAVEIEQLGEKQIVQDLYALTRALLHPADRVAWLAILRAPWVGMTLEELHNTVVPASPAVVPAKAGTHFDLVWNTIQSVPSLDRFRTVLAPALANRQRGSLRDRVEGVWLALGGPACAPSHTDLEDAAIYLDELERLEHAGTVDLALLEEKLEKLFALPDVDAGPDALEIMTIHKAKGLQWDTVIVPGLDRPPRSGDRQLMEWKQLASPSSFPRELGPNLLLAPVNASGTKEDPLYEYVRDLNKEAEDLEAGRLFYVAATRAKNRLHLLACGKCDKEGETRKPSFRSLLAKAWFNAESILPSTRRKSEQSPVVSEIRPKTFDVSRLPQTWSLPAAPAMARWSLPIVGRDEQRIEFSWAGELARHVGTIVHKWLQILSEQGVRNWPLSRIDGLRPRIAIDLKKKGVSDIKGATERVIASLANAVTTERGAWLLGSHHDVKREYRIRTLEGSKIIDLLFVDSNGDKWVVDFKVNSHAGGDLQAFLDREFQRYSRQLEDYAKAVSATRKGIYFAAIGQWKSW